ncbi:MAG: T9SS type B sorting domain-containing protein [Bacteroidetes bacterium]|nr:T9SS type B sorting domain-containing protein [Bacteroidota bacterium]
MQKIVITLTLLSCFAMANAQWVTTVAGVVETPGSNDGPALSSRFFNPHGIAADTLGHIFIADQNNHVIRILDTNTHTVTTLAGTAGISGSNDGIGSAARFHEPLGICATPDGVVYVADTKNNKIRKITLSGKVETIAGTGNYGTSNGLALSSTFGNPTGIEIDAFGNLYVADHLTNIIRKVSTDGFVTTVAGMAYIPGDADGTGTDAQFWRPYGLTIDHAGNILVADEWNHKIRKVTPQGIVTTLAGNGIQGHANGPSSDAMFNYPWDVTVDDDGNVFVADGYNYVIRKIEPNGVVSTVVGNPQVPGYQDGQGSTAAFKGTTGLTWSTKTKSVFVCDSYNHVVRELNLDAAPPISLSLVNLNGSTEICEGDALNLSAAPQIFNNYRFYLDGTMIQSDTSSSFSASQLTPGPHTIKAETDYLGQVLSSNLIAINITEIPTVSISAVGPLNFYEGDSFILIAGGTGQLLWSNGEATQTITVTTSGDYFVELTASGCTSMSQILAVQVTPLPDVLTIIAQAGQLLCSGGTLVLKSSSPTGNQWLKDGWHIAGQTAPTLEVSEIGVYQVQATDPSTGITALSNELEVQAAPVPSYDFGASQRIAPVGQSITFSSIGNDQPVAFEWQFGDPNTGALNSSTQPSPTHRYDVEGQYSVALNAKDAFGCRHSLLKSDFIRITSAPDLPGIFIPNAFTPNGDGENDQFRVRGQVDGPFFMAVFNQWGEPLFQSENPDAGWDGLRNGLPVQSGTYAYFVKINSNQKEKVLSGMVTLLR